MTTRKLKCNPFNFPKDNILQGNCNGNYSTSHAPVRHGIVRNLDGPTALGLFTVAVSLLIEAYLLI